MHVFICILSGLFILFSAIYFIYLLIHVVAWTKLKQTIIPLYYIPTTKISVIIPARNEESAISACINAIAEQTYPAELIEVIIIDDHSTDKTKEVAGKALSGLKIANKLLSNSKEHPGKKNAITNGIKSASGELMIITDADCKSNANWLSVMEYPYRQSGACMICGPVQITGQTGFLGFFQSMELCGLSLLSASGIWLGIPLLCNGANMAYTRKMFEELEGFKAIDNTPSGDDTLFMFKAHEKYPGNIVYVKSKDAIVYTSAQTTLHQFLSQRIRWASKGLASKNRLNSLVSLLVFSVNFLSLIAIPAILVNEKLTVLLMCGLGLKIMADFLLLLVAINYFGKKKLLGLFPVAEVLTMLYTTCVGIIAPFSSYNWKGRLYKHSRP